MNVRSGVRAGSGHKGSYWSQRVALTLFAEWHMKLQTTGTSKPRLRVKSNVRAGTGHQGSYWWTCAAVYALDQATKEVG